eukprot:2291790-Heterocapsa_arctica.AAC.1
MRLITHPGNVAEQRSIDREYNSSDRVERTSTGEAWVTQASLRTPLRPEPADPSSSPFQPALEDSS